MRFDDLPVGTQRAVAGWAPLYGLAPTRECLSSVRSLTLPSPPGPSGQQAEQWCLRAAVTIHRPGLSPPQVCSLSAGAEVCGPGVRRARSPAVPAEIFLPVPLVVSAVTPRFLGCRPSPQSHGRLLSRRLHTVFPLRVFVQIPPF